LVEYVAKTDGSQNCVYVFKILDTQVGEKLIF